MGRGVEQSNGQARGEPRGGGTPSNIVGPTASVWEAKSKPPFRAVICRSYLQNI